MSQGTSQNSSQNSSQSEYNSLITLFKYLIDQLKAIITFVVAIFTAVAAIVGWLTYSNGQEMREAMKEEREELRESIKEMKDEVKESKDDLKRKELELLDKEKDLERSVDNLGKNTAVEINDFKSSAVREIGNVRNESVNIARGVAKDKIEEVFKSKNVEGFIVDVAKQELEPKITKVVESQINDYSKKSDEQLQDVQAVQYLRSLNIRDGKQLASLDSLYKNTKYSYVKKFSKEALSEIKRNYFYNDDLKKELNKIGFRSAILSELKSHEIKVDSLNEVSIIDGLYKAIYSDVAADFSVLRFYYLFGKVLRKDIDFLDYTNLNKVYQQYKKNPYPLSYK